MWKKERVKGNKQEGGSVLLRIKGSTRGRGFELPNKKGAKERAVLKERGKKKKNFEFRNWGSGLNSGR